MAALNWIGKNVLNERLYRSLVNARNPRISARIAVLAEAGADAQADQLNHRGRRGAEDCNSLREA
jgi:hypothetical protein